MNGRGLCATSRRHQACRTRTWHTFRPGLQPALQMTQASVRTCVGDACDSQQEVPRDGTRTAVCCRCEYSPCTSAASHPYTQGSCGTRSVVARHRRSNTPSFRLRKYQGRGIVPAGVHLAASWRLRDAATHEQHVDEFSAVGDPALCIEGELDRLPAHLA